MGGYRHGVYVSEIPTSIIPPVEALAGLPVVVGTAPIHLVKNPKVNEPVLCYSYKEAVEAFGYSDDFESYTLCEFMKSHFTLFSVAPVVFINVLDPAKHKEAVEETTKSAVEGGLIIEEPVLLSTVVVKNNEGEVQSIGEDYELAFNAKGHLVISLNNGRTEEIKVAYSKLTPATVSNDDVIGSVGLEGQLTGLELVNEVLPRFGLVPGQLLAPKFSTEPTVAAVMVSKASNINGYFKCMALTDIPVEQVTKYSDVAQWKTSNNYVYENQIACWPKVRLGDAVYHMSTQLAGLMCKVDASYEGVPYVSPSNHNLQINGLVGKAGKEVILGIDQANYLNGQGIVTAINFSGGWKVWGNRTACYPSVTDPKDAFIPVKRMFYWIATTIVQTFWQKVDAPITRRLVDTVMDSINIWLNGLTASGYILGGRVEFLEEENPSTSIMDGNIKFHLYLTPPSPAREIDFVLEYDVEYLKALFA